MSLQQLWMVDWWHRRSHEFLWSTNPLLLEGPPQKSCKTIPMSKLDLADGDHWLTPKGASIWTQCHPHPERAKRTTTTWQHSGIANGLRSASGTNITSKFRGFKFFFNRSSLFFLACDMHRSCKTPKAWRSQLGGRTRQAKLISNSVTLMLKLQSKEYKIGHLSISGNWKLPNP